MDQNNKVQAMRGFGRLAARDGVSLKEGHERFQSDCKLCRIEPTPGLWNAWRAGWKAEFQLMDELNESTAESRQAQYQREHGKQYAILDAMWGLGTVACRAGVLLKDGEARWREDCQLAGLNPEPAYWVAWREGWKATKAKEPK